MTQYYVNKSENTALDFKCTACGYVWTTADSKQAVCPSCGYACNPYSCQILPASGAKPADDLPDAKKLADGFKCTACGYIWTVNDAKQENCPSCGYACNPYACQVVFAPKQQK